MGFRSLRVINDDVVAAGRGFPEHPHRDMEIFSYVLEGALAHRDSLGNERILTPGQIQLMSAGTGVRHSEFNPSYTEWHPSPQNADDPKVLVISPDGRDGSASIKQDAEIYRILLEPGQSLQHEVREGRGIWLQIAEGSVVLNGITLETGDAAATEVSGTLTLTANSRTNALLFDLH
jgi:hypothetical protein